MEGKGDRFLEDAIEDRMEREKKNRDCIFKQSNCSLIQNMFRLVSCLSGMLMKSGFASLA